MSTVRRTETKVSKSAKAAPAVTTTVVTTETPKKKNKKKNKKKKHGMMSSKMSPGECYAHCLLDPFNSCPERLGINCLQPTSLVTAKASGTFGLNADGSGQMLFYLFDECLDGLNPPVRHSSAAYGAASVYLPGVINPAATAWAASARTWRPIGASLRGYVRTPLTADPAVIYTGILPNPFSPGQPNPALSTEEGRTTSAMISHPLLNKQVGVRDFVVNWFPSDMSCYDFRQRLPTNTITGTRGTIAALAFVNFSGALSVEYEWTIHGEYTTDFLNVGVDTARSQVVPDGDFLDSENGWFQKTRNVVHYVMDNPQILHAMSNTGAAVTSLWSRVYGGAGQYPHGTIANHQRMLH
jgi:hypothetical protein